MPQKTNSLQDSNRMYMRVIDYIKQEITAGRLQVGSKLPPERTMAEMLGVSRNSVREAVRVLEIMGTTVSVQGAGHFIASNFESAMVETLSLMFVLKKLDFRQISQLRYALELKSFTLAVNHATEQDLADLREIISQLDMGLKEEEENVLLDKRLHYSIARASGNQLFVEILQALSDVMDRFIADLRRDIMSEESQKRKLYDVHRRIVENIFTKDIAAGSAAVAEHFALIDQQLELRGGAVPDTN
ncbi:MULTISPECIES: FadR/GntR family transcriptional regulator [environmental samples]|uniref:FadR/GntR family transcriptional regulator n=1 Tax=environmental samples TaxID=876090 RepID=UPI00033A236A|nr:MULTISPECIES: FadR/GntR family transcriptional regulator [environmental samples]CDC68907.1 regulatory protein GntR HTH [Oscillibacter sp. CAG:155]